MHAIAPRPAVAPDSTPRATPAAARAGTWRSLRRAFAAWWTAPRVDLLSPWPRHRAHWNEDDFTPETVRARILRASPFPYR